MDDAELLKDLLPQVYKVVNPKFPRDDVVAALRDHEYVANDAIRYLLEQEPFMDFGATVGGGGKGGDAVFAMDDEDDIAPPPGFEASAKGKGKTGASREPLSDVGRLLASAPAQRRPPASLLADVFSSGSAFAFNTPSPDDEVLAARSGKSASNPPLSSTKSPAAAPAPSKVTKKKDTAKKAVPDKKTNLKTSNSGLKTSTGGLKSSATGLKTSTDDAPPLKTSVEGTKKVLPAIRPEKRTKQLVDELLKEAQKSKQKLNMVVIGHVDAGKSTLVGHLLHLLGCVDDRTMHKHKKMSEAEGKASFHFAWVMDSSEEERKRGVTIDVGLGHFETQTKSVTLLDAPGHLDFVPNMIMGAAQAEVALLVIDCTPNNFENGFSQSGQTREHALLARSLGVKQLIVVVNKLDSVGWSEQRFNFVRDEVSAFLTKNVGFRAAQLQFVPCSGFKGVNVVENKEPQLLQWYKGPPLVTLIDKLTSVDKDLTRPTRFYVTEVLGRGEVAGVSGLGLSGKVEAGIVAVGDQLLLLPVGQIVTVKSLKLSNGTTPHAVGDGDSVEMGVQGQTDDAVFGVGDILCDPLRPITVVRKFRAQIVVFQPPRPLLKGDQFILHMHAVSVQCRLSRLRAIVDKKTGEVEQRRPRLLPHRATAIVDIRLDRPMCMELFTDSQQFGRFMLRTNSKTCAAGVVTTMLSTGTKSKSKEDKEKDKAASGSKKSGKK